MKRLITITCFLLLMVTAVVNAHAPERQDKIWARNTTENIILDGVLNEASWAWAESLVVKYGDMNYLPTSGWAPEFQGDAVTDPTNAIVKFLAKGNQLYIAFVVPDSSIVGARDWARWDAILMSIKDKGNGNRPIPPLEFFYTYWFEGLPDNRVPVPGDKPRFVGRFGSFSSLDRTPEQVAAWDAFTNIKGQVNDGISDSGYVIEMRIALDSCGYDATVPDGDMALLNFSIWDCDYTDQGIASRMSTTRTHWQSPWGNANGDNVGRVFIRPDVTITSGDLPEVEPDVEIPNAAEFPDPVIDGTLDDAVWPFAYTFDIAWGDSEVRAGYPGAGALMSGQFQPDLDNNEATPLPQILDAAKATIRMILKGHFLYLSADVDDQLVQGTGVENQFDGVRFLIGDRMVMNTAHIMEFRSLYATFGADGNPAPIDYLPVLVDSSESEYVMVLKGATTVNVNTDVDEGYRVEMKVDLRKLGYAEDLGDFSLFGGVMLSDGDSFDDPANNYGSRTWWFREHGGGPAAAYMYLSHIPVGVEDDYAIIPSSLNIHGNYPNPFNPVTSIQYSLPSPGNVKIFIYNVLGQEVKSFNLSGQAAGLNTFNFNAGDLSSGIYLYKISYSDFSSSKNTESKISKMVLIK